MTSTTKQEAKKAGIEGILSLIKSSPQMIVFLFLVCIFLWFFDRREESKIEAEAESAEAMREQSREIRELIIMLKAHVNQHGCVLGSNDHEEVVNID